MINVQLLAYTPEPQKIIANAAKLCYSSSGIDDLRDTLTEEKVDSFLSMLNEIGHESPIEHANFTFGIEGVSRSLLAQITRHRLASFSVQSQRYVKEAAFEFVLPPEIEAVPEAKEIYLKAMKDDQEQYDKLTEILQQKHYDDFVKSGKPEKTAKRLAEKKAIEDARFVLPNACTTKMLCTFNARSLNNFFSHRCCERAQWEIRELSNLMLEEVKKVAPVLFEKAGPPCLRGNCPEGKMSCGKMLLMREQYLK
ncbi:MAG: FAD-dependent thymidylate synthase [Clostridia bacterium]